MDDIESQMLLSHVETWMVELEREVRAFEAAVEEVEEVMDDVEYAEGYDNVDGQIDSAQNLQQLERAFDATERIAQLVHAAESALSEAIVTAYQAIEGEATLSDAPLEEGSLILNGQYRIIQLLHQRPRLNLYLAKRQAAGIQNASFTDSNHVETPPGAPQFVVPTHPQEPLVAIRELVLTGLPPQIRQQIEHAAFEEFVSPGVLGSPRLPGAGDRVRVEGERHYLVMQLRRAKGERPVFAVTLAELLLSKRQWPSWLDLETALEWGIQLCRIVARLHRMGTILGDLDPATVLVDNEGAAQWAPVLLVSWPPPPQFWPAFPTSLPAVERHTRIFPAAHVSVGKAFAAPEMLNGVCDSRSDVYSLGALLYLLLTRYAPASAARRMRADHFKVQLDHKTEQSGLRRALPLTNFLDSSPYVKGEHEPKQNNSKGVPGEHSHQNGFVPQTSTEGMALIAPHLFNNRIPPVLEQIVLRALAFDPKERYSTVFELVEALESEEVKSALAEAEASVNKAPRVSRVGKVVEWLKRELSE